MASAISNAPARPKRRRRALIALSAAVALALILADQLGCRRASGKDYPISDPLSPTLKTYVETLAQPAWEGRLPGMKGNTEAAHYLERTLKALGVGPLPSRGQYRIPLPDPTLGSNVIGYLPPADPSDKSVIVLGAHFDHLGVTKEGYWAGADDNASSVAVLLGALPAIMAAKPKSAVVVALFNTEEAPYFGTPQQGSRALVSSLPPEIQSLGAIRLALVMDLVGGVVWREVADSLFACGAEKSLGLGALVDGVREPGLDVRRLGIHAVEDLPGYGHMPVSDYDIFRLRGVPFLFLSVGRTPRYHTFKDTPETLYYDRMARTSRWIAKLVTAVDAADKLRFDARGADYERDQETLSWAIGKAARPWSAVPGTSPLTAARLLGDTRALGALAGKGNALTRAEVERMERSSFRLQCLLYSYPICFTL